MRDPQLRQTIDACSLSFVAGFVDTCVFVGLFGLFTAHVTGNMALVGAAIVHRSGGEIGKLLSLPVFVAAVVITVHLTARLRRARWQRVPIVLWAEALLLVATAIVAIAAGPRAGPDDAVAIAAGMCAVAAMGMQNALMRVELSTLPATTVMTVNVTQVVVDAVMLSIGHGASPDDADPTAQARARLSKMWPPVLAFTVGAACGAFGYSSIGWLSLLVPAAGCAALGVAISRR